MLVIDKTLAHWETDIIAGPPPPPPKGPNTTATPMVLAVTQFVRDGNHTGPPDAQHPGTALDSGTGAAPHPLIEAPWLVNGGHSAPLWHFPACE
jgi:hypothetical protein